MTTDSQNKGPKRLLLLDGMALVYRAHFALIRSPRFNSAGLCTSAVYGLANTLMDLLKREEPTHICVVFDTPEPTERHEVYPEYKAQRDSLPEDIGQQLPYVDRLFYAFGVTVVRLPGYEADDIIGTIAHEASAHGFESWMVTPDKDYDQLVGENTYVLKPGRKGSEYERLGVSEVLAKWGIDSVAQVIDILGLMGDSSDNIPGVPGIGPKTAQKLIAKYDSMENLLDHVEELKGKQKERLIENADLARLSKQLVTIQLDVPHGVELDSLAIKEVNEDELKSLFEELEFDSLGKRVFGKTFTSAPSRAAMIREKREAEIQTSLFDEPVVESTIEDVPHVYRRISTREQRAQLIAQLEQQTQISFDTETTGLDPRTASLLGIAFSFEPHTGFYVTFPEKRKGSLKVLEEFRGVFENEKIEKIGHNLKYDLSLLKWYGFDVAGPLLDTMLAHSMKEPEMRHGLDYLSKLYLGYRPISITDLIGERGPEQKNMKDIDPETVCQYACEDADVTLQVSHAIRADIDARGVAGVCYDVECPLIPVLVDMEHEGIRLDVETLQRYSKVLGREIEALQSRIFDAAGREFNIDSPKQLGIVLYEDLALEKNPKRTATGQYSTREAELERLSSKHKIIADILDYRNAVKLKSVYVDQLPDAVDPKTDRVHTHYSQTWTATGRIQSNNPNLQTIPIRKKRGREIRAAFVARNEDFLILSADYSQIELRIMAELSQDKAMNRAFRQGVDIHRVTAANVYQVDVEDVTREMRDKAKMVNFGILYGISAFGLQQRLNIPRQEANSLIEGYFQQYTGVQEYIDSMIAYGREHGYVRTLMGRRRYLRDINSRSRGVANAAERLAMNSPIQGTAADMLKMAMIKVNKLLKGGAFETKMLLTVHDEIVFDLYREEQKRVLPLIEEAMKTALPMKVPIVVEMGTGHNWLEAH
ncbi:MAG: DNA polymerase I [Mariniblastus sp.]|nr:DNA polymerase I [Mariniblastus sp.]